MLFFSYLVPFSYLAPADLMSDPSPLRFASPELARKIASIHGKKVQTVKVKMVGKKDVTEYLKKVQAARSVQPSANFRVK
ncbi:MAG: hypothetical protein O3A87_04075 [Verrucomicrobia bacterium]|nr:hypothetical protein [Verrucomicrobiota bacterium]MDA1005642.1 hypothetical protein [Verrucomicrobiota bacterium]